MLHSSLGTVAAQHAMTAANLWRRASPRPPPPLHPAGLYIISSKWLRWPNECWSPATPLALADNWVGV